jgi:hypothetical protein
VTFFIRNQSPNDCAPSWEELERITEEIIEMLSAKVNRNSSEKYDLIIAKTILTSTNLRIHKFRCDVRQS